MLLFTKSKGLNMSFFCQAYTFGLCEISILCGLLKATTHQKIPQRTIDPPDPRSPVVLVLNGGYPLGVATGVKGVFCSLWELLVAFNKSHKIQI